MRSIQFAAVAHWLEAEPPPKIVLDTYPDGDCD